MLVVITLNRGVQAAAEAATVAEPGVLTLPLALELALGSDEHPELAAARHAVQAGEARQQQAGVLPNPELGIEVENIGGDGDAAGMGGAETTVSVEQLIEIGGKRGQRQAVAAAELTVVQAERRGRRQELQAAVTRAFIGVLAARQRLVLAEQREQWATALAAAVTARVAGGEIAPPEATRASIPLASAKLETGKRRRALAAAQAELTAQLGGKIRFAKCEGTLAPLPAVPDLALLRERLADHPELQARKAAEHTAEANAILAAKQRYPDLTVSAGARHDDVEQKDSFLVGISMPLPLFDRNRGGILEAEQLMAQAEAESRALALRLEAELVRTHVEASNAQAEAEQLQQQILPLARQSLEAVEVGYRSGKFSLLDMLDAQRTWSEAEEQYSEALIAARLALNDITRLTGVASPITP